jgi:hypothetical protein
MGLMHVDNGPDVAYHLGSDLKEAKRIASLPPVEQLLAIGRLSEKLAAAPQKQPTPSRAPAPVTPLNGTTPLNSAAPSEQDDMKQWMQKRQKQVHGARR